MLPKGDKFREWASIEKMVYKLAHKVFARVLAAQLSHRISVEDLIQEGAVAWVQACEKFDPEFGCKFSTYLHRAVLTNLNRYVDNNGNIRHGVKVSMSSINQPVSNEEGATKTLEEVLNVGMVYEPDTLLEIGEDVELRLDILSSKAKIIYALILSPPDWLREEFAAAKEQARLRREMNIRPAGNSPPDIIVMSVIAKKLWDIGDEEFKGIRTEIWRVQYGS